MDLFSLVWIGFNCTGSVQISTNQFRAVLIGLNQFGLDHFSLDIDFEQFRFFQVHWRDWFGLVLVNLDLTNSEWICSDQFTDHLAV